MSAGDLAAVLVSIASIVGLVVVLFAASSLLRTMRELRAAIARLDSDATAALTETRAAVGRTHDELERVDGLLERAEHVSATVDSASRLTYVVLANPLIKVAAAGAGARRAAHRLRRRS